MIADALQFLTSLQSKADAPHDIKIADPRARRMIVAGQTALAEIPIPPRSHKVATLEDLAAVANRFAEVAKLPADGEDESKYPHPDFLPVVDTKKTAPPRPVAWFNEKAAEVVLDDSGHRVERTRFALNRSDVFAKVEALASHPKPMEQKAFIRFLRIDLAGTLQPGELLAKVRDVKFENGQTVSVKIGRHDENLGKTVTSQVRSAAGEIPEEVTLSLPVFKNPGESSERLGLRCAVEVDPAFGTFQLIPLPDEVDRVRDLAVASIGERLRVLLDPSVPCYHGSPE